MNEHTLDQLTYTVQTHNITTYKGKNWFILSNSLFLGSSCVVSNSECNAVWNFTYSEIILNNLVKLWRSQQFRSYNLINPSPCGLESQWSWDLECGLRGHPVLTLQSCHLKKDTYHQAQDSLRIGNSSDLRKYTK